MNVSQPCSSATITDHAVLFGTPVVYERHDGPRQSCVWQWRRLRAELHHTQRIAKRKRAFVSTFKRRIAVPPCPTVPRWLAGQRRGGRRMGPIHPVRIERQTNKLGIMADCCVLTTDTAGSAILWSLASRNQVATFKDASSAPRGVALVFGSRDDGREHVDGFVSCLASRPSVHMFSVAKVRPAPER